MNAPMPPIPMQAPMPRASRQPALPNQPPSVQSAPPPPLISGPGQQAPIGLWNHTLLPNGLHIVHPPGEMAPRNLPQVNASRQLQPHELRIIVAQATPPRKG